MLPNGVCSRSECGLVPSLWRCVSFCPISYDKSIGGRSSSRWRAGRATSSRRSTGRSRRVAAASHRSGRSARRARPREARFVHVVDLARQSHRSCLRVVELVYSLCGQAITAAAGRRLWRSREFRRNVERSSRAHVLIKAHVFVNRHKSRKKVTLILHAREHVISSSLLVFTRSYGHPLTCDRQCSCRTLARSYSAVEVLLRWFTQKRRACCI